MKYEKIEFFDTENRYIVYWDLSACDGTGRYRGQPAPASTIIGLVHTGGDILFLLDKLVLKVFDAKNKVWYSSWKVTFDALALYKDAKEVFIRNIHFVPKFSCHNKYFYHKTSFTKQILIFSVVGCRARSSIRIEIFLLNYWYLPFFWKPLSELVVTQSLVKLQPVFFVSQGFKTACIGRGQITPMNQLEKIDFWLS